MNKSSFNLQKGVSVILCFSFLFTMISPSSAFAEDSKKKIVRIGVFEDNYDKVNEDGEMSGYGYEYIQKIAGYTGWTYEYVYADWSSCFTKLQNGEIDIINGISYTDDRAENMLFSDIPMGMERYYIYANMADTEISAADLTSFNGKTIGVLEDKLPEVFLDEWEDKNNLHTHHVNISTTEDILNNLATDKMDCFVSVEERWNQNGLSPVINIGSSDIYFAINKDRPDLKTELDNAMRRITSDNPFYADDLYRQYLSAPTVSIASDEEQAWLKEHGPIRIGYLTKDSGVSSIDPVSGTVAGVINDYVDYAKNCLDNETLDFETQGFGSMEEELEALKNGAIDVIFKVPQSPYYAEQNEISLSDTAMTIPIVAITSQNYFDENEEKIVAAEKDDLSQKWFINYKYPNWKIIACDSFRDARRMVEKGLADCVLVRSGRAHKYIKDNKYHAILLENNANISFGVNRESSTLLSILNKTLKSMPSSMLSNTLSVYESTQNKVTISDFFRDNMVGVVVFFSVVIIFVSIILALLRRSKIAEAKATEAMILAENANAAKSNFLFNMSHDIRTPMNAILGFADLAVKRTDEPQIVADYLHKIQMSGAGLMAILDKVLEISRIEAGKTVLEESPKEVGKILDSCIIMMNPEIEKKHLEVTVDKQIQNPYVYFDEARITEVILNILSNAIKYTANEGRIHCTLKQSPHHDDNWIYQELLITDNGIGMSDEFQKHIFDLFARERSTMVSGISGSGLGMGITKRLVELMNGTINVKSKIGDGTTVSIRVPLRVASFEDTQPQKPAILTEKERLQGKRILLAEDNDLNAEIAITLLEEEGLLIDRVADGVECVEKLEHSDPGYYTLILMDIQMPIMDGYQATAKIRKLRDKRRAEIPIIAMTANAFSEDKAKALEVGMNAHVAKPIDMNILLSEILKYI